MRAEDDARQVALMTRNARRLLSVGVRRRRRYSTVVSADLIAVGGDPRHDLAALPDLRLVLARGEPFSPDALPPIPPLRRADLPGFAFTAPGADAPPPPQAQTA